MPPPNVGSAFLYNAHEAGGNMRKSMIGAGLLIAAAGAMAAPTALAADLYNTHEESRSAYILYNDGPVRKLGRGLANLATGSAELPLAMEQTAREEGELAGATLGTLKGIGKAVGRTLAGGFETLTFLFPNPDIGYTPMVYPEYTRVGDLF